MTTPKRGDPATFNALHAERGEKTMAGMAARHGPYPSQVMSQKGQLPESAAIIHEGQAQAADGKEPIRELREKFVVLIAERDFSESARGGAPCPERQSMIKRRVALPAKRQIAIGCLFMSCASSARGGRVFRPHQRALLVLGLMLVAGAWRPAAADPAPLAAQFQAELEAIHDQRRFPGATAAYILPDGTVGVAATGMSDVEHGIPMTPDSRMLAASVGKTLVASAVLGLAQEGVLTLDDPISKWLGDRPWFPRLPNYSLITIRQLLTHTSGTPDYVHTEKFARLMASNWREPGNPLPPEALIELVLDGPPLFKPGEAWGYSDTGYLLVGLIIEKSSGHGLFEEITRRFLDPLDLKLTTPSNRVNLSGLATGYMSPDNELKLPPKTTTAPGVMAWNPAVEWAGGGFISNPRDLVVWAKSLYEGTAMPGCYLDDLLRSVSVDPPGAAKDDDGSGRYGAGVAIRTDGPFGPSYGHGGWIPGYASSVRYYPSSRVAIAFQINTDIGIVDHSTPVYDELEDRLARVVIERTADSSLRQR